MIKYNIVNHKALWISIVKIVNLEDYGVLRM
jgi:hypothetical protein